MRKVKAKKLRKLARALYDPKIPANNPKRIYKTLKKFYKEGEIPKDFSYGGTD